MTGIAKYCTIDDINVIMPERNMINLAIDRTGATMADYDVIRNLENYINDASTDMDAMLRRYASMPLDPDETGLTGNFQFVRGSTAVTIVGGAATTELEVGDEIRPDDNEDIRLEVASITNDTTIVLKHVYYGEVNLTGTATKYETPIPKEIRRLVRDHVGWTLWSRRTEDENNPLRKKEEDYQRDIELIQKGQFRFTIPDGELVKLFSYRTDLEVERTFNDDSLEDYAP